MENPLSKNRSSQDIPGLSKRVKEIQSISAIY